MKFLISISTVWFAWFLPFCTVEAAQPLFLNNYFKFYYNATVDRSVVVQPSDLPIAQAIYFSTTAIFVGNESPYSPQLHFRSLNGELGRLIVGLSVELDEAASHYEYGPAGSGTNPVFIGYGIAKTQHIRYEYIGSDRDPLTGDYLIGYAMPGADVSLPDVVSTATGSSVDNTPVLFTATRGTPTRLSLNGLDYDAVPLTVTRDGKPWRTWFYAYNLGIVQLRADDPSIPVSFTPVSFPPPIADGVVVEYRNTTDFPNSPGGHFYYSTDPAEQAVLDGGALGRWSRTGPTFKSGGYVQMCRFYGSLTPGPNSHFFSSNDAECATLRVRQQTPPPANVPQWNEEGAGFSVMNQIEVTPGTSTCMNGTRPIYRLYNNAFTAAGRNPWDSNHRYTEHLSIVYSMVGQGWTEEGVAFCVPR